MGLDERRRDEAPLEVDHLGVVGVHALPEGLHPALGDPDVDDVVPAQQAGVAQEQVHRSSYWSTPAKAASTLRRATPLRSDRTCSSSRSRNGRPRTLVALLKPQILGEHRHLEGHLGGDDVRRRHGHPPMPWSFPGPGR